MRIAELSGLGCAEVRGLDAVLQQCLGVLESQLRMGHLLTLLIELGSLLFQCVLVPAERFSVGEDRVSLCPQRLQAAPHCAAIAARC